MQGSKYYRNSQILTSVFERQDRMSRPREVEQVNTPFHFVQKTMTSEEKEKLMQKRIYEHPQLFVSTHAKCQICNKFIKLQEVDVHSRVHFEQAEKIERILANSAYTNPDLGRSGNNRT